MLYSHCSMLEDFYTVTQWLPRDGGFTATVALNAAHPVYAAHFPGNPVTPGVCVLQISKELLETTYGMRLRMTCAKNVKFLRAINPLLHTSVVFTVNCTLEDEVVSAAVTAGYDETVFVKISATYSVANG